MRVLVTYATQLGSTQGIAERIADTLVKEGLQVELHAVEELSKPVASFDGYVIGSAVHAGHWLKPAREFVELNAAVLAQRPVWLFSSGPIGEKAVNEPQPDPKEVEKFRRLFDPRDHIVFAGAFDRETADGKGGLLGRAFYRFIPEGDFRDWPAIEGWARGIATELKSALVAV